MLKDKGFTLIELLIVVAIIAILAAIAIPNFLQAQVRSKVSRTLSDFRSINTGLESYYVDNNDYPATRAPQTLSTPISYLSSFPRSPWNEFYPWGLSPLEFTTINKTYLYVGTWGSIGDNPNDIRRDYFYYAGGTILDAALVDLQRIRWEIKSVGPDSKDDVYERNSGKIPWPYLYDPTNGTVSPGDLVWFNDGYGTGKNR